MDKADDEEEKPLACDPYERANMPYELKYAQSPGVLQTTPSTFNMSGSAKDSGGEYTEEEKQLGRLIEQAYPKAFPNLMRDPITGRRPLPRGFAKLEPDPVFTLTVIGPTEAQERVTVHILKVDQVEGRVGRMVQSALERVGAGGEACTLYKHVESAATPMVEVTKEGICWEIEADSGLVWDGGGMEMLVEALVLEGGGLVEERDVGEERGVVDDEKRGRRRGFRKFFSWRRKGKASKSGV